MFMLLLFLVQFTISGSSSDRIYRKLMYVIGMGHDMHNLDVLLCLVQLSVIGSCSDLFYGKLMYVIGMGHAMKNMVVLFWDGWFNFGMNVNLVKNG